MCDQNMTTFDDADWSEDSHMDECDPGAPLDFVAEASAHRYADFSHGAFVHKLRLQILPNDEEHREGFDNPTGKPEWDLLFDLTTIRVHIFYRRRETSIKSIDVARHR